MMVNMIENKKIIAYILLVSTLFISPSLLSLSYSYIGIMMGLIGVFVFIIFLRGKIEVSRLALSIIIFNSLYWFFILLQTLLIPDTESKYLLQTSIINLILLIVFCILLNDKNLNYIYFRNLIRLIYILCLSFTITILLSEVISIEKLLYYQVNIGNYHTGGSIYFPFTAIYGIMHSGELALPKFQLFFRESGIAQAFIIWSIFNLKKYKLNKKRIYIILHIGLIGTFSTTAIAIYFITLASFFILSGKLNLKQLLVSMIILCGAYYGVMNIPFIGIQDKLITHSASIEDRLENNIGGVKELILNPFGQGFKVSDSDNEGISILALTSKIGLIGLILLLLTFFGPMIFTMEKGNYLFSILPIFLTALLAQPIAGDAMMGIILLSSINIKEKFSMEGTKYAKNLAF
ncbi:hypothetical protein [Cytobacillus firmus]|uniref:hypothetical protein n=1 Tax=Cytobacillus firmus TaxID=1399 RepID=UPI00202EA790|nr:hypothetical protein [Cytobacillus firmus]URT70592.1 hypothetical protein NAF01_22880 [Cytobacillus firmus]